MQKHHIKSQLKRKDKERIAGNRLVVQWNRFARVVEKNGIIWRFAAAYARVGKGSLPSRCGGLSMMFQGRANERLLIVSKFD